MAEKTATSGVSYSNGSYYRTVVTDNGDGTYGSNLLRTDAQGNNPVSIASYGAAGSEVAQVVNTQTATPAEQQLLANPDGGLNQVRQSQTQSLESEFWPGGAEGDPATAGGTPTGGGDPAVSAGGGAAGTAAGTGPGTAPGTTGTTANAQGGSQGTSAASSPAAKDGRSNNYPEKTLVYPLNRTGSSGSDFIKFTILEYKKSGLSSPENLTAAGKSQGGVALVGMEYRDRTPLAYIFLPIQNGIVDSMSVDWGSGEINPITASFASFAMNAIQAGGTGDMGKLLGTLGSEMSVLGKKTAFAAGDLKKLSDAHFTQQAVQTQGLLARTSGSAINNNLELLFNGPMLRSFTFTFKLTPREEKEASLIKSIIRYFKKSMVPSLSQSQLFLLAPNVFKIEYIYTEKGSKADPHPYLNRIKVAALRDFTVNYAPDGNYMTYQGDGSMTQYEISMTFGEIDPIYEQDYEKGEGLTGMGW